MDNNITEPTNTTEATTQGQPDSQPTQPAQPELQPQSAEHSLNKRIAFFVVALLFGLVLAFAVSGLVL